MKNNKYMTLEQEIDIKIKELEYKLAEIQKLEDIILQLKIQRALVGIKNITAERQ